MLPVALICATETDAPDLVRTIVPDPVIDAPNLHRRFLTFQQASRERSARLERECALLGLLEDLAPAAGGTTRPSGDASVARALEYLRDSFLNTVDLDTLATAVGTSKFRLLRRFRAEIGVTPHQFLTSIRVAHARRLLAAGTAPSSVAAESGFADQSHLTRHFRHRLGLTPARYQRLVRAC